MGKRLLTVQAYAEKTGRTVANVQYHCRNGNLDAQKVAAAGYGVWFISENAVITCKRRGRKLGSRNKH